MSFKGIFIFPRRLLNFSPVSTVKNCMISEIHTCFQIKGVLIDPEDDLAD